MGPVARESKGSLEVVAQVPMEKKHRTHSGEFTHGNTAHHVAFGFCLKKADRESILSELNSNTI